jgi:hypothetical protein
MLSSFHYEHTLLRTTTQILTSDTFNLLQQRRRLAQRAITPLALRLHSYKTHTATFVSVTSANTHTDSQLQPIHNHLAWACCYTVLLVTNRCSRCNGKLPAKRGNNECVLFACSHYFHSHCAKYKGKPLVSLFLPFAASISTIIPILLNPFAGDQDIEACVMCQSAGKHPNTSARSSSSIQKPVSIVFRSI